jgi:ribose-phosphate pyrophosphokinase
LCKAADVLVEHGARSVRAYCTHAILSGSAFDHLDKSKIEKLFISDTVLENVNHPKIEVVSCATLLASAIENTMSNKSFSQL